MRSSYVKQKIIACSKQHITVKTSVFPIVPNLNLIQRNVTKRMSYEIYLSGSKNENAH